MNIYDITDPLEPIELFIEELHRQSNYVCENCMVCGHRADLIERKYGPGYAIKCQACWSKEDNANAKSAATFGPELSNNIESAQAL